MSIIFPPSPPVEFDTSLDALLALFLAMSNEQRAQIAQLLVPYLPIQSDPATAPVDAGQAFINESGFVVIAV